MFYTFAKPLVQLNFSVVRTFSTFKTVLSLVEGLEIDCF
jgi:hypothetical protein